MYQKYTVGYSIYLPKENHKNTNLPNTMFCFSSPIPPLYVYKEDDQHGEQWFVDTKFLNEPH